MQTLRNKSILIIDDDAGMRRALDKVLTGEGAVVTCANCVGGGVAILIGRQTGIDLVITDLRMPPASGLGALQAIRQFLPALPVIVLTAFGTPDIRAECLRLGASAFLEKPLDTPQLLNIIEGVCRGGADAKSEPVSSNG
jgi:DNA-binding NtrC family response regulator